MGGSRATCEMNGLSSVVNDVAALLDGVPRSSLTPVVLWLLGITFIWSGVAKLRSPFPAAMAMVSFRIVKRPSAGMAVGLSVAEVVVGVWFLTGFLYAIPAAAASLLLTIFAILIGRALIAGEHFECSCFGGGSGKEISAKTLVRAIGLLLMSGVIAAGAIKSGSPDSQTINVLHAVASGAALMLILLLSKIRDLRSWNSHPFAVGVAE